MEIENEKTLQQNNVNENLEGKERTPIHSEFHSLTQGGDSFDNNNIKEIKVGFISSLSQATGNCSTAKRIVQFLHNETFKSHKIHCTLADIEQFSYPANETSERNENKESFIEWVDNNQFKVVIGIHAYRAGKFIYDYLQNSQNNLQNIQNENLKNKKNEVKFAIILGGTDLNEDTKDPSRLHIMRSLSQLVHSVIAFSDPMKAKSLIEYEIKEEGKVRVINPSMEMPKIDKETSKKFSLRKNLNIGDDEIVFLLPSGIRPVKNPLFLFPFFSQFSSFPFDDHLNQNINNNINNLKDNLNDIKNCINNINNDDDNKENNNKDYDKDNGEDEKKKIIKRKINYVIVGPILEKDYFQEMQSKIEENKNYNIKYHRDINKEEFIIAMKESNAMVNTSNSEGLANVLLEAMCLQVPIIARDIEGNSAVIRHLDNGFLYSSCDQFKEIVQLFFDMKKGEKEKIIKSAYDDVTSVYSPQLEKFNYLQLIVDLLSL